MFPRDAVTIYPLVSLSSGNSYTQTLIDVSAIPSSGVPMYTVFATSLYQIPGAATTTPQYIRINCGGSVFESYIGTSPGLGTQYVVNQMVCSDDLNIVATGFTSMIRPNVSVTYVPYNITTRPDSSGDIIFSIGFVIFFLSMLFMGMVFNSFIKRDYK